jgi:predicted cupin superfamily sugar epimerase
VHPRAAELIQWLHLQPHPEGGFFAEVFRSRRQVRAGDVEGERSALTSIYFLLAQGDVSHWHRLDADETWHFYEGEPLDLLLLDAKARILSRVRLGPAAPGSALVHAVPAGSWLAARASGAYALVGCSVAPGFEFSGFSLMRDAPAVAVDVVRRFPEAAALI